jgi:hypothetical protein
MRGRYLLQLHEQRSRLGILGRAREKSFGENHPSNKDYARVNADALDALGRTEDAAALRRRHGIEQDGQLPI